MLDHVHFTPRGGVPREAAAVPRRSADGGREGRRRGAGDGIVAALARQVDDLPLEAEAVGTSATSSTTEERWPTHSPICRPRIGSARSSATRRAASMGSSVIARVCRRTRGAVRPRHRVLPPARGRIRETRTAERRRRHDVQLRVTISLGVWVATEYDSSAAIAAADSLLYRAKESGRNRVEMEAAAG